MIVLSGHYSEETAYLIESYPYGGLRCKMRCWLEVNKKGTRFITRTSNPKENNEVWNAPKMSTYCIFGAMYLDHLEHVYWAGLSRYDASKARDFLNTYKEGLTTDQCTELSALADAYDRYEAKKAAKAVL